MVCFHQKKCVHRKSIYIFLVVYREEQQFFSQPIIYVYTVLPPFITAFPLQRKWLYIFIIVCCPFDRRIVRPVFGFGARIRLDTAVFRLCVDRPFVRPCDCPLCNCPPRFDSLYSKVGFQCSFSGFISPPRAKNCRPAYSVRRGRLPADDNTCTRFSIFLPLSLRHDSALLITHRLSDTVHPGVKVLSLIP